MLYSDLSEKQKTTLCADLKRLMSDMDALGVEILDLTFFMEEKRTDAARDTTTPHTTPQHQRMNLSAC